LTHHTTHILLLCFLRFLLRSSGFGIYVRSCSVQNSRRCSRIFTLNSIVSCHVDSLCESHVALRLTRRHHRRRLAQDRKSRHRQHLRPLDALRSETPPAHTFQTRFSRIKFILLFFVEITLTPEFLFSQRVTVQSAEVCVQTLSASPSCSSLAPSNKLFMRLPAFARGARCLANGVSSAVVDDMSMAQFKTSAFELWHQFFQQPIVECQPLLL
jgi:hypothetical protein